jgi:plasmid maintenance system antidote protein VapI
MPDDCNEYRPDYVSPPGDTLLELLAERAGLDAEIAERLISGHEPLTREDALSLEYALGIRADFWIERERQYRASEKPAPKGTLTDAEMDALEREYEDVSIYCAELRRDFWRVLAALREARGMVAAQTHEIEHLKTFWESQNTEHQDLGMSAQRQGDHNTARYHKSRARAFGQCARDVGPLVDAARRALAVWRGASPDDDHPIEESK